MLFGAIVPPSDLLTGKLYDLQARWPYCDYCVREVSRELLACIISFYEVSVEARKVLIRFGEKNESRWTGAQVARFYTR